MSLRLLRPALLDGVHQQLTRGEGLLLSARKEIQLGRNEYWVATIAVSPLYINSMPRAAWASPIRCPWSAQ